MGIKIDFSGIASGVGKAAEAISSAKDMVVKAVDQNDDGSIDLKDVAIVAETISETTKTTASLVKGAIKEKNKEMEKAVLQPIFEDDLDAADFSMTKLVRITDIDKRRAESEVCKGAIGYMSPQKEMRVINMFTDKADAFGVTFYPDKSSEIYYVDPSDRDRYIALDDYFSYLKVARVSELQKIAQDLGARHFKVTYKEQKASFSKLDAMAKGSANIFKAGGDVDAEKNSSASEYAAVEIAAEATFPGHAPTLPKLKYLQKDPSIQALIAMRMDEKAPISQQRYTLKLSNTSGIKEKDAIKIDAALKVMKISGNATVVSEAKNESRRYFEYEIDF